MQTANERLYTLEIAGKPVLTFAARNLPEAQSVTRETWLQDDLQQLRSKAKPCGTARRLSVRNANDVEASRYERESKAVPREPDDMAIVYLIELY